MIRKALILLILCSTLSGCFIMALMAPSVCHRDPSRVHRSFRETFKLPPNTETLRYECSGYSGGLFHGPGDYRVKASYKLPNDWKDKYSEYCEEENWSSLPVKRGSPEGEAALKNRDTVLIRELHKWRKSEKEGFYCGFFGTKCPEQYMTTLVAIYDQEENALHITFLGSHLPVAYAAPTPIKELPGKTEDK